MPDDKKSKKTQDEDKEVKLIMENWRKFLKEGISDVVYHYTSGITKAAQILEENKIYGVRWIYQGGGDLNIGKGKLYYFSTARTPINCLHRQLSTRSHLQTGWPGFGPKI